MNVKHTVSDKLSIYHGLLQAIVRYKIIRYKKFMPPDKPLYQ